jgi:N-acetylglutamate synthase-like GNAT family acetyltransferase
MIETVSTPTLQVRRATVDDIPKLIELWRQENLPAQDLEGRFKEFQVIENGNGGIAAAIGLQVAGQEGRLHSEVFEDFGQADTSRGSLWERVRTVAQNHGLVRVWTQFTSPYWRTIGFDYPSNELLTKLPNNFGADRTPWLFVQLRQEVPTVSLDKEFALFRESEREQTEKMMRQARMLKILAGIIAVAVLGLVVVWAIMFFRVQRNWPKLR